MAIPAADIAIDRDLAARLIAEQHPDLSALGLGEMHEGWDCTFFRLGDSLAARFPRREQMVPYLEQEFRWLPQLGPFTSVEVPLAYRLGERSSAFPWPWCIVGWVDGAGPFAGEPIDQNATVDTLRAFFAELHTAAAVDAPPNPFRGGPVRDRRDRFASQLNKWDQAAETLSGLLPPEELLKWFDDVSAAPDWADDPVWIHGDLHGGNVIARDGRLRAVIDWVDVTSGDPSVDLVLIWNLLDAPARRRFRSESGYDDATWLRAQGWALSFVLLYAIGGPHVEVFADVMWQRLLEDR